MAISSQGANKLNPGMCGASVWVKGITMSRSNHLMSTVVTEVVLKISSLLFWTQTEAAVCANIVNERHLSFDF